jgi:hypothetical protein
MDDERKTVDRPTYYHLGDVSVLKVLLPGGEAEFIAYDLEEAVVQRNGKLVTIFPLSASEVNVEAEPSKEKEEVPHESY